MWFPCLSSELLCQGNSVNVKAFEKIFTLALDIIAFNVAFVASVWLRYKSGFFPELYNPDIDVISYFVPIGPVSTITFGWVVLFFLTGLYREWYKESRIDVLFAVTKAVIAGLVIVLLITRGHELYQFVTNGKRPVFFTRATLAIIITYGGCFLFFATANRLLIHSFLSWLASKGIGTRRVLVVGANESGASLVREIAHYPHLGNRVVGFIDDDGRKKGNTLEKLPVFGTYSDIPQVVKKEQIQGIIISHVSTSANEILRVMEYCADVNVDIYMVPSLLDVISGHFKTHQIFGVPLMVLLQDHMSPWEVQVKRLVDIIASLLVLGFGAPLWIAISVLIRWNSPGPALYKQKRAGKFGRPFMLYKFRSMYQDAEARAGPQWASKDDPRITPLGRFIRKTRIDEIPQFINVLRGEMSLVGPRPERPVFINELKKEIPWYIRRLKMKPGITGWAQVKHKYDETIEDVKKKVMYDLYYFENMSLALDLKIILRTVLVVLTGKGAH
ncbi:MAG: exopolysaccharide biosynthesis polyprenyl glycosylphosphotransferase [Chitinivibrionales bacterium]|nr:exopolysaccharide biosynthesis polyprenyl glycosylphosphotransferase [Chitinivibrionales bacterium]